MSKNKMLLIIAAAVLFYGAINFWKNTEKNPRVSIITSIWNGDDFIEGFLADITQQTIFPQSELILINANSPGNEEAVINRYTALYPNIRYIKLDQDPGIYSVWNRGIVLAKSDIVTNANLDDRSCKNSLEIQVKELEADPSIDLVYAGYYITQTPNETFDNFHISGYAEQEEFSKKNMMKCLPGPRPVWRKSMHDKYGYFSEVFISAGDWEMWLRAANLGSKFKKVPGFLTLYFLNPVGLSTVKNDKKATQRDLEFNLIVNKYKDTWK